MGGGVSSCRGLTKVAHHEDNELTLIPHNDEFDEKYSDDDHDHEDDDKDDDRDRAGGFFQPEAGEIDIPVLLCALDKLTLLFEVNEVLTNGLIDEVVDRRHMSYDAQHRSVNNFVRKHSDVNLSSEEILSIIKYVEACQLSASRSSEKLPLSRMNSMDSRRKIFPEVSHDDYDNSSDKMVNTVYPSLLCPYQCHVNEWTASIKKATMKNRFYDGTTRLKSLKEQEEERRERAIGFYHFVQ